MTHERASLGTSQGTWTEVAEHKDEKGTCVIAFQRRLNLLLKRLLERDRSDSQGFKAGAQCARKDSEGATATTTTTHERASLGTSQGTWTEVAERKDEKGTCAIAFQRLDLLLKRLLEWDSSDSQGVKAGAQYARKEGEELVKVQQEMGKILQDKDHSIKVLQDQLRADYLALLLLLLLLGCRVQCCVTRSLTNARDGAPTKPAPSPQGVPPELPTPAKLFGDAVPGNQQQQLLLKNRSFDFADSHSPPNDDPLTSTGDLPGLAAAGSGAAPGADGTLRPEARRDSTGKEGHVTHGARNALAHLERLAAMQQQSPAVFEERPGGVGIPPTQLEQRLMGDTYSITADAGFCDDAASGPERAAELVGTRALVPAGTSSFVRKASSATGFRVVSPATSVTSSIADAPGTPSRLRPVAAGELVPPQWEKGGTPR